MFLTRENARRAVNQMLICFVIASRGAAGAGTPHPGPLDITMEEKVRGADAIFIGEATGIYFVDQNYDETKMPSRPFGLAGAAIDVRVVKTLFPTSRTATGTPTVTIDIASAESVIDEQRREYLGKQLIYFTKVQEIKHVIDANNNVKPRQQPITRHYFPRVRALRGPTGNPLPLELLGDVKHAIHTSRPSQPTDAASQR